MRAAEVAAACLLFAALPLGACELDGLDHGYGPSAALFAGAHRYQSLNGLDDAPHDGAINDTAAVAAPSTQRRSFAVWPKARPKPSGTGEEPSNWVRAAGSPSLQAPGGAGAALSPPARPSASAGTGRVGPASRQGPGASRGR